MTSVLPVLLWDRLAIAPTDRGTPAMTTLEAGDSVPAFCAFLEGLVPTPRRIRLFYQSPALESVSTGCPHKADRRLMRLALGTKFPALGVPTTVWGFHPPRPHGSGASTLLYLAQNGFLPQLRAALSSRQINLEAAYPLPVLLETDAVFHPPGTPAMAVIQAEHGTGVFWLTPSGDRHVSFFTGPTAGERLQQEVDTGLSIFEEQHRPPLLVINATARMPESSLLQLAPTQKRSIGELLAAAALKKLPATANLVPIPSRWFPTGAAHAAAVIVFLCTFFLGQRYLEARHQARVNLSSRQILTQTLSSEVSRLESTQASLERAESFVAEVSGGPRHYSRFLAALGRQRPPQITITSVSLNESSWNIRGVIHEGLNDEHGPFPAFIRAFCGNPGWSAGTDSRNPRPTASEFTLSGTFP